jgi:hypothetical protein
MEKSQLSEHQENPVKEETIFPKPQVGIKYQRKIFSAKIFRVKVSERNFVTKSMKNNKHYTFRKK